MTSTPNSRPISRTEAEADVDLFGPIQMSHYQRVEAQARMLQAEAMANLFLKVWRAITPRRAR